VADTKVSALTAATLPLDGTELLPVVQGGTSKQVGTLGLIWKVAEIDFGTKPQWSQTFTITDAAVASTSHIAVACSGQVATGRTGDDWAWDALVLTAVSGTGSFALTAYAIPGPVVGKRKIQYQIG
jgi:hypothetical protein